MENYFQMNFNANQLMAVSTLGLAHIGDGVYELLEELKNRGYKLATASSKPLHFVDAICEKLDIKKFFDFLGGIANEQFGGKEEFESIRSDYPEWVTELDMKSGVLGTEGYIYTTNERS